MVTIPSTTLNALKGLLFNSENGVDLTPIVQDLTVGNDNEDLTAINVALTFKGMKPKIDSSSRFDDSYKSLIKYDFISFSLIRNMVTAHKFIGEIDTESGELKKTEMDDYGIVTIDYNRWCEMETTQLISIDNIKKRFYKE